MAPTHSLPRSPRLPAMNKECSSSYSRMRENDFGESVYDEKVPGGERFL